MKTLTLPNGSGHIAYEGTEMQLVKAHRKVMMCNARIDLIRNLMDRDLCTQDINAFINGQAELRECMDYVDKKTMRDAMRTKLKDLKMCLRSGHRLRKQLEEKLLSELNGKSYSLRKKVKHIRYLVREEKKKIQLKHQKKIEHYVKKQNINGKKRRQKIYHQHQIEKNN